MASTSIIAQHVQSYQLPDFAFTRSKIRFDPRLDEWAWKDGAHALRLDFRSVPIRFSRLVPSLKRCLMVFATGYSSAYVTNLFNSFLHFARANQDGVGQCHSISTVEVSCYRAGLEAHQVWRVGGINPLLQKWFELGLAGVEEESVDYLRGRRKPGNTKGAAVRQRDPKDGPFSDQEFKALFRAVEASYGVGELAVWVVVLFRLLAACGGRVSQYVSLKIVDFIGTGNNGAARGGRLDLPQAKTGLENARDSFLRFDLSPQTAHVLSEHIAELQAQGFGPESAMFPASLHLNRVKFTDTRPTTDLFYGHSTSGSLRNAFCRALQAVAPLTERLGFAQIPITPRRFRYTFGTRMAEEGCSKAVIANRLGHTDLQNVDVYFEASPAIVENIDRAMDAGLAPIAEAFRGRLIEEESQSTLGGAPGSRIIDFRTSTSAVGSCGKNGGCSFNKPVACYTCFKFEPWLDAPHEELLARLQAERGKISDERIAAVNDDAIKAIKEVIAECLLARGQGEYEVVA